MIDRAALDRAITAAAEHYEKSAPTVTDWLNDLYVRLNEEPDSVRITEIFQVARLNEYGWTDPPVAANQVYHLMHRLGQDVSGHAGF